MPILSDWAISAVAILIAFPALVIVLGELVQRLRDHDPNNVYLTPLSILRNGVLPLAFIDGLLRIVMGLDDHHLAVKIADTGLWIVVINAAAAALNGLLFGEQAQLAGRVRLPRLLLDLARFLLVLCGAAIVIARIWGVDLSSLVTALGVSSVVLGLALQDTLGSIFSGIALVSARQVHVGDWIKFGGDEGIVLAMNWRAVKIRTTAGDVLYVPNGVISKASVRVLTIGTDSTTVNASLRFPYGNSPDAVMALLTDVAKTTEGFLLDPPPDVRVNSLDAGDIEYVVAIRSADPRDLAGVRSEYLANVWFATQRGGCALSGALKSSDYATRSARHTPEAIAEILAQSGAFHLDADELGRLAKNARLEQFRAGETLVRQGAVIGDLYVLASGRATATVATGEGRGLVVHGFEPGQTMMAKSLFQGRGTPFDIKAASEIEVVAIPLADFKELCLADFALAREVEQILTARDEAAMRILAKTAPEGQGDFALSDRMQLMRDMFRS